MNGIYTTGAVVLRVSRPTADPDAAIELHEVLRANGIPVARPARAEAFTCGALSVTCWERIVAVPAPVDWRAVGAIMRRVHALDAGALPGRYPLVAPSDLPWWDFDRLFGDCGDRLDPPARAGIERDPASKVGVAVVGAVAADRGVPRRRAPRERHDDRRRPRAARLGPHGAAPVGWDHAPLLTWTDRWGGAPRTYEDFADGYGLDLSDDPVATGYAELRLVAATLMRVIAATRDPAARPEVERRLAYWRGDPNAPAWTAQ